MAIFRVSSISASWDIVERTEEARWHYRKWTFFKDGLSHGQVGQRPYERGHWAMFVLKDLADGKSVESPIYTGLDAMHHGQRGLLPRPVDAA